MKLVDQDAGCLLTADSLIVSRHHLQRRARYRVRNGSGMLLDVIGCRQIRVKRNHVPTRNKAVVCHLLSGRKNQIFRTFTVVQFDSRHHHGGSYCGLRVLFRNQQEKIVDIPPIRRRVLRPEHRTGKVIHPITGHFPDGRLTQHITKPQPLHKRNGAIRHHRIKRLDRNNTFPGNDTALPIGQGGRPFRRGCVQFHRLPPPTGT